MNSEITLLMQGIAEHLHIISHLQKVSQNHPSLFERVIARHRRDIADLQRKILEIKQNRNPYD